MSFSSAGKTSAEVGGEKAWWGRRVAAGAGAAALLAAGIYFLREGLADETERLAWAEAAGRMGLAAGVGGVVFLLERLRRARRGERRLADALREAEARLAATAREAGELRAALDGHAMAGVTDAEGRLLAVNARFCAVSGFAEAELLGGRRVLVEPGASERGLSSEPWAAVRAGGTWRGELRHTAKDGSFYWTETTLAPVTDEAGRTTRCIVIQTDITARKRGEEELRRRGAELQALFDLNPAMIWFKDTKNNHLRVNRRAAEAAGLEVAEIEGRPASAVYPEQAEHFYRDDLEVIASGRPKLGIVERIPDARGRMRWIRTDKVPCLADDGRVTGIIVSAHDITERREAEEALRESEERFRQLAENIDVVFWMFDAEGGRLLYVSPAYRAIWGREPEDLYRDAEHWLWGVHPEDRERVRAAKLARLRDGDHDLTYRVARPDGEVRWVRDRGFPVRDESGRVLRMAGTATDITEHRRLQARFFHAQKTETLGVLAGGIAHDFNNILGGVIGYTELAKMRTSDNAAATGCLDAALTASRRAADLVRQILAFSRSQEQRRTVVQLRHLVSESLKLLRAATPSTIEFGVSLASDVAAVRADPGQIHQVMLNLCAHVIEATGAGPGRLEVRLENHRLDESEAARLATLRAGDHVKLSVAHSEGLQAARISGPGGSAAGDDEQAGSGLAVVRGVMEAHEGALAVRAGAEGGACFELYFPAMPAAPSANGEHAGAARGGGERVLFVDDEPGLAELGRDILAELGYRATACSRPLEALAIMRADPGAFDLLVTDYTMPQMTGCELAAAARELRAGLPVLLVTGHAADLTAAQSDAAGVGAILNKPFGVHSLGRAVRGLLRAPAAG